MLLNCGVAEDSLEYFGLQWCQTSQSQTKSVLNIHWNDWCWNSNTLAIWCKELTHWERPWFWERLKAGEEGDDRRWDGWIVSPTRWTWVRASSGSWWRTGTPGMLHSMGLQRAGHDWVIELNWTWCAYISLRSCFHFLGYIPRSEIAESYGNSIYNFWGNHHTIFIVPAPIYIPSNSEQVFPFVHILTNTYLLSFWW